MSSGREKHFIETREYRRFAEFCDACRQDRYIGLCYGPPGVGKTLSARYFANWESVSTYSLYQPNRVLGLDEVCQSDTIIYTPGIVNTPGQVKEAIAKLRSHLRAIRIEVIRRENEHVADRAQQYYWSLTGPGTDPDNLNAEAEAALIAMNVARHDFIHMCHSAADPTMVIGTRMGSAIGTKKGNTGG